MKNINSTSDERMRELMKKYGTESPPSGLSQKIMERINKEGNLEVQKQPKWKTIFLKWMPFLAIFFMAVLTWAYYIFYLNESAPISGLSETFWLPLYKTMTSLFDFLNQISFSPFVFISIASILLLLAIDKIIIRMIHTL
mgnify:CR=1 FL=1